MNQSDFEEKESKLLLQGESLFKTFGSGESQVKVLQGVDITIQTGEMIAIIGASGSGKTTLLQILGTLDTPTSGKLLYKGADLTQTSEGELSEHRNRRVGFIFQFHHLLPEFSALENVMMPGLIAGNSRTDLKNEALTLLEQVGLGLRCNQRRGERTGG